MTPFLRLYDTLTLQPPAVPGSHRLLFQDSQGSPYLLVRIAATHAARLTGNHTFYPPHQVRAAAPTFTLPYKKPVLVNHNQEADPIGRVQLARYVDTSMALQGKYQQLVSMMRDTFRDEQVFSLIELLEDELHNPHYTGLGYLEVVARIVDPAAVQKILDGRYQTVSVGFITNRAYCSVCRADWVKDGRCEHQPGKVVDGKPCFLVTGEIRYDELSFVNRPADSLAGVLEIVREAGPERVEVPVAAPVVQNLDAYMGSPEALVHVGDANSFNLLTVTDAYADLNFLIRANRAAVAEWQLEQWLQDGTLEVETLADRQMLIEVHNTMHMTVVVPAAYQTNPGDLSAVLETVPMATLRLHAKIHTAAEQDGFVDHLLWGPLDYTLPALGVKMPSSMQAEAEPQDSDQMDSDDTVSSEGDKADMTDQQTNVPPLEGQEHEEQLQDLLELGADSIYDALAQELLELAQEAEAAGDLAAAQAFRDAKLTAEQRAKLKASVFCGPDRSFPVPDCAHVVAARRLIGRYKGPGDKDRILACVNRKAKAMGCDKGKGKDKQDCCPGQEQLQALLARRQELLAQHQQALAAIDEELRTLFDYVPAPPSCPQCQELRQQVERLRRGESLDAMQLEAMEMDLQMANEEIQHLQQQLHQIMVDQIMLYRQLQEGRCYPETEAQQMYDLYRGRSLEVLHYNLSDLKREISLVQALGIRVKGMAQQPELKGVVNPVLAEEDKEPVNQEEAQLVRTVMQNWYMIAQTRGQAAARAYWEDMQKRYPHLKIPMG